MSALGNLQDRLASTFGDGARRSGVPRIDAPPLAPENLADGHIPENAENSPPQARSPRLPERLHRYWLSGGGLVAGVLMLSIGYAGGPLALAAFLILVAVAIAVTDFVRHSQGTAGRVHSSQPKTYTEHQYDRQWEQDERAMLLATIHDQLGDIAVTRNMDRRIVRANTVFRQMTGRPHPEGMSCEELGLAFRPGTEPNRYDVEMSTPLGQRIFAWHDVMIRDPASGDLMVQSIARDVTDERLTAHAREEARLKAEYINAAKSRLLATVSHEIRTPLSGILGMSHLLSQTNLTAEQGNYLAGIRQSGNALVQLVEDLLDFSTIEVGRFELRPRAEPLRQLIESVVEMLSHRAHEKGIEVGTTVSADVPELMNFDPARLRQVLFNVIGNAVKFTHQGGVLIRAGLDGADLLITVRDSGPGMTPAVQARIFGEYEQAGDAIERSGGTGLGLPISARIIKEFGGSLTVTSEKGKGSEFTIRFPLSVSPEHRGSSRRGLLKGTRVLLLAPDGPASIGIASTIRTLGGHCQRLEPGDIGGFSLSAVGKADELPTDIIVDHRMAPYFFREFSDRVQIAAPDLRKIFLVNPEERAIRPLDLFDAWLIRPLREQSLIDVLSGRMRGMEKRDAINDNQRGFGPAVPEVKPPTGLRIVLGEDDPVNAMLVRATLVKAGHNVQLVGDFETLLGIAAEMGEDRLDLMVTDLSMPGGEGLDVLARIRAGERRDGLPALPILVLTADHRQETHNKALLEGADAVLAKPVDPERLVTEVQRLATRALEAASVH
ncbi:ATP-binding protein [Rhizobium sp. BK376]|uniref:hybrid sensor histidine kinase/response regulator n=1 Tax=Rhizobium sp. BK376 TaxID=2512149 RepID=UPI0010486E43|nr:ATP-binding protein [Rhizobium sp. BK376]TCR90861.1 signal transduction histidine kinase [Rhizobium sp. BK376]